MTSHPTKLGRGNMKPHIVKWKGLYECYGKGLHSFDVTPAAAYNRWLQFNIRMRED